MKVLVIGGYGTGSTVVYNIVRHLFIESGAPSDSRGASQVDIDAGKLFDLPGNVVIKSHDCLLPATDKLTRVLLCKRNLFDAAASIHRRMNDEEVLLNTIRQRRIVDTFYEDHRRVLQISYEYFCVRQRHRVRTIASFLGFQFDEYTVSRIAMATGKQATKRLQAKVTDACPDTEIRPDHIGPLDGQPGAGKELPVRLRLLINAIYKGPPP